jgi:hypothetical protein
LSALKVPVNTIDSFCAARGLTPDWVTIDIEGYEVAALAGARDTIKAARNELGIIVEIHPSLWLAAGTSRDELEALLAELSLRPVALTGQADTLAEYGLVRLEFV